MKKVFFVLLAMSLLVLSACDSAQPPAPDNGVSEVSPLPAGWDRATMEANPEFYNVSEVLPDASKPVAELVQDPSIIVYSVTTTVLSRKKSEQGNAYIGGLTNNSTSSGTISQKFTKTWTASVSGGFDTGKIKSTLGITSSRSVTQTASANVAAGKTVKVYAHATGELSSGYQTKRIAGTSGACVAAMQCTTKEWSAFKPEGMGFKYY